jgi:rare lipoprotein A
MRYGDGPVDVLLVEDLPGDVRLTKEAFNHNGLVKLRHVLFWSVGLALAWLITSPAQAHSRGFAWFFAHSRPQGSCAGPHVVATFYASGRRTASGQTFDPSGYTAAHRSLPFGSRLTVTNPQNGSSVTVVINDRGPFTRGVTLDLSPGAARAIGMHRTQWLCML